MKDADIANTGIVTPILNGGIMNKSQMTISFFNDEPKNRKYVRKAKVEVVEIKEPKKGIELMNELTGRTDCKANPHTIPFFPDATKRAKKIGVIRKRLNELKNPD